MQNNNPNQPIEINNKLKTNKRKTINLGDNDNESEDKDNVIMIKKSITGQKVYKIINHIKNTIEETEKI